MITMTRAAVLAVASLGFAATAWADKPDDKPKVKIEFRRAETKPAEGLVEAAVPGSKEKIYLHKEADATSADIPRHRESTSRGFPLTARRRSCERWYC